MSNTLVISDVHLGSPVSRVKSLVKVLKNEKYDHLIINGDLFDNRYLERYKSQHWKALSILRKIAKKKEVTFIIGNHDIKSKNIIKILGLHFVDKLEKKIGSKNFLFQHFHQFDPFIFKHPWITNLAEQIYYFVQSIDRSKRIARFLKKNSKSFLNIRFNIRNKAIYHIKFSDYDAIVGGHIHYAEAYECPDSGKEYYNSGSFCDDPCHYLLINSKGEVSVKEV
jgi:UDP-2,3-diacylglucosamine pyrophosphatase LpxH